MPLPRDRWKIALGLIAVIGLGAALAPALRAALAIAPLMRHARWPWLLAALVCQSLMYACVAKILSLAVAPLKNPPSIASLYFPAVAFLFANRAIPGPAIAGLATLITLLGRKGVPATDAQVAAGSFYLADYASFFVVIVFAAITLLTGQGKQTATPMPYLVAVGMICLLLIVTAMAYSRAEGIIAISVLAIRRIETAAQPNREAVIAERINGLLTGLHTQSRVLFREPMLLAILIATGIAMHACEAATLVCAASGFDAHLSFAAAAGAYVAGNLAAIVSFLPGGVGLYDGAMISVLHTAGHLALPAAGATTIVYRLLSLAAPFPFALNTVRQALAGSAPAQGDP